MCEYSNMLGKFYYCVISGTRGVVADQYLDLSQAELIAVIVDKEIGVCGMVSSHLLQLHIVSDSVTDSFSYYGRFVHYNSMISL